MYALSLFLSFSLSLSNFSLRRYWKQMLPCQVHSYFSRLPTQKNLWKLTFERERTKKFDSLTIFLEIFVNFFRRLKMFLFRYLLLHPENFYLTDCSETGFGSISPFVFGNTKGLFRFGQNQTYFGIFGPWYWEKIYWFNWKALKKLSHLVTLTDCLSEWSTTSVTRCGEISPLWQKN